MSGGRGGTGRRARGPSRNEFAVFRRNATAEMPSDRPAPAFLVPLLACPVCRGNLAPEPGGEVLRCPAGHGLDGAHGFPVTGGIARLLPPGGPSGADETVRAFERQ